MATKAEILASTDNLIDQIAQAAKEKVRTYFLASAVTAEEGTPDILANALAYSAIVDIVEGYAPRTDEGRAISDNLESF